jgi:hypothetical protein
MEARKLRKEHQIKRGHRHPLEEGETERGVERKKPGSSEYQEFFP